MQGTTLPIGLFFHEIIDVLLAWERNNLMAILSHVLLGLCGFVVAIYRAVTNERQDPFDALKGLPDTSNNPPVAAAVAAIFVVSNTPALTICSRLG